MWFYDVVEEENLPSVSSDKIKGTTHKITHAHVAVPAETLNLRKPTRQLRANHKHKYQTLPAETTKLK